MSPKRFWQACSSHNSTICQIRFKKTLSPKRFWQIVVRETICMLHLWARSQAPLWAGQLIIHPSVGSGWTRSWQVPSLGYLEYQNHPVETLWIEQWNNHPIQLLLAVNESRALDLPVGLALLCAVCSDNVANVVFVHVTAIEKFSTWDHHYIHPDPAPAVGVARRVLHGGWMTALMIEF